VTKGKESLGQALLGVLQTKDDVTKKLTSEFQRLLRGVDPHELFLKLLSGATLEVQAQIRLVPSKKRKSAHVADSQDDETNNDSSAVKKVQKKTK
jgi:hypothetical protein